MPWTTIFRRLAILGIAGAGGCVVGPNYHPSPPTAPVAWTSPVSKGLTDRASGLPSWWASFNDVELDSLIQRATQSNLDLRVAAARVRQARAVRGGSAADLAPEVNASASAARAK